jgi:vacuolar-type H+-ATPase subunit I/STV1
MVKNMFSSLGMIGDMLKIINVCFILLLNFGPHVIIECISCIYQNKKLI